MPKSKRTGGVKEPESTAFDVTDDGIDLSDIPELDAAWFAKAKVRLPVTKEAVSIRLDSDVLEAFRTLGPGYQTRINSVLRKQIGLPRLIRNALRIYKEEGETAIYLRTDEIEELIGALEHCASLASELDETTNWKWLIISLHNAVQGACVCSLRGEDSLGISVLTPESAKEVLEWHEARGRGLKKKRPPIERLASMLELYTRVQDKTYLSAEHRLPLDKERDSYIKRLNERRNEFIHFIPQGLSLELSGMPRIVKYCADIVDRLAVERPSFARHLNELRVSRMKAALEGLRDGVWEWSARMGIPA